MTLPNGQALVGVHIPTLVPLRESRALPDLAAMAPVCWLVSKFHDFTVSFKSLTWPKVGVAGTLWLSDLLSA
jgi:hypothetical protein